MESGRTAPTEWTLLRGIRQLLTLRGPSGPRRGTAASVLDVIPDAAMLLRNGIIERMGRARGVENAREARQAQEVNLRGSVVLPAFVEPDAVIAPNGLHIPRKQREGACSRAGADRARYGYLSAGAHTAGIEDFREGVKMLRSIQKVNLRPLRLRPILSLPFVDATISRAQLAGIATRWLPAAQKRRLASVVELVLHDGAAPASPSGLLALIQAAAGLGFTMRFRSIGPLDGRAADFMVDAGAIAVIAPLDDSGISAALEGVGVHVVPCSPLLTAAPNGTARIARDAGISVALSSGYNGAEPSSLNPQLMLFLACSRLGFTEEEAITAMTWNAACSLRMSNAAGCLDVGRPADLVAVDVPHYAEMVRRAGNNDVELVMRGGRAIYQRSAVLAA